MKPEVIDCDQGSADWFAARRGIPTASEFATIIGVKKDAKDKKTRQAYMRKLAGEIITGEVVEGYSNAHMERGKEMEGEARDRYAFQYDIDPVRVGFIRNGRAGCSPDSLVGTGGMLEIKTCLPHILIEKIEADDFPPEHRAQCQGGLYIANREYIDIAMYWPKLPLFVKRAHRDEGYIATIAGAIKEFNVELDELVERIRRYGSPERAAA
jgi:hypothetical protein